MSLVTVFQRCCPGRQKLETRGIRDWHELLIEEIPGFTLEEENT